MSEKMRQSPGSDVVRDGRIKSFVGRIIDEAAKPDPHESGWEMNTGEGAAIAAGAEELEGLDLDEILSPAVFGRGRRLNAVLQAVEGGLNPDGSYMHPPELIEGTASSQAIQQ